MKYIKLFEAFESQVITNTIKFLNKKVGEDNTNEFIYQLKKLLEKYKIPISEIKEDDIEYYNTRSAIKVKNNEDVDNRLGIYCIKYWFSLENGYLIKTATGNITTPYVKIQKDYSDKNKNFDKYDIDFIKDNIGIKKGKLSPVLNYSNLKTGDIAIVRFDGRVIMGKIFVDNDSKIFLYNKHKSDGTTSSNFPDFASDYAHRWRLASHRDNADDDHKNLHIYTKDNKKLRQEEVDNDDIKHTPNLADFNKPIDEYEHIDNWTYDNQYLIKEIEKSDFAVIIYIDRLLSIPDINTIKNNRNIARSGATSLMSDYDIKQININNYTNKLITKYGLHKNTDDFSKLNKFVNNIMCDKFVMINLYLDKTMSSLDSFINQLYNLVNEDDDDNKEYYFNNVLTAFKSSRTRNRNINELYRPNLDIILNSGDENLITIIKRLLNLGEKINDYIESVDIENIHDIIMVKYKLKAIEGFIKDSKHKLTTPYYEVIDSFDESNASMSRYVKYCQDETEEFEESMKRLDIIEKFINSLFKVK